VIKTHGITGAKCIARGEEIRVLIRYRNKGDQQQCKQ